jgi:hypothetical protein
MILKRSDYLVRALKATKRWGHRLDIVFCLTFLHQKAATVQLKDYAHFELRRVY